MFEKLRYFLGVERERGRERESERERERERSTEFFKWLIRS